MKTLVAFIILLISTETHAACKSFPSRSNINDEGSHRSAAATFFTDETENIPKGWWKFSLYRGDPPSCQDTSSELSVIIDDAAVDKAAKKPSDCDYVTPYMSQFGVFGFHKSAPIQRQTPTTFCIYVSGNTRKIQIGSIGVGAAQCSTYYMTVTPPSCGDPINGGSDPGYAASWEDITSWDENDQAYYKEIPEISAQPRWKFQLPEDAYEVDIKAGKFASTWTTNYRSLQTSLGTNVLWTEPCSDPSTCPEWEFHNMRPDLYPSAKEAPVYKDTDKPILAKRGNYYFYFTGTGKSGLRLSFKDINGKPIKTGKSPECGGTGPTPTPKPGASTPTPTPTPNGCIALVEGYNASIYALDNQTFNDNETKNYCYEFNAGARSLDFLVEDRTTTYCSRADVTVYPPAGSSIAPESRHYTGYANIIYSLGRSQALPRGTYRIEVTNKETPGCNDKYYVRARIPSR